MCWSSAKKPIRKIATEDITCYKVFFNKDIIWDTSDTTFEKKMKEVRSLYMKYVYIPYMTNSEVSLIRLYRNTYDWDRISLWCINEGYHSYETLKVAKKHIDKFHYIVECIIPKNSIYYINKKRHIVSSNIIVTDKIIN